LRFFLPPCFLYYSVENLFKRKELLAALSPLRVAPRGRYFQTADGEPFLFIGPNDAITWPGLSGLFRRRDVASVEAHLRDLADSGVTIVRLMLEYAHVDWRFFEKPVGRFNPRMVSLWDDLFELCERFGLRVLLAPYDNFWMTYRWHKHPYNVNNGGPAQGPGSFFTDEATIQATENRMRFVSERWGGCGAFAAWDLFNEIHPYWGGSVQQQSEVITRLSRSVREVEESKWGFSRLQTVSIFGPDPGEYSNLIYCHPKPRFRDDAHLQQRRHRLPTQHGRARAGYGTLDALQRGATKRPFTDSEHGPIHLFNDHKRWHPEEFDDEYERHLMWAHLASGGAGSGMRWPARHPHVITAGMRRALKSWLISPKVSIGARSRHATQ
jgi:mannan endo-1,4-beta-mannosidase